MLLWLVLPTLGVAALSVATAPPAAAAWGGPPVTGLSVAAGTPGAVVVGFGAPTGSWRVCVKAVPADGQPYTPTGAGAPDFPEVDTVTSPATVTHLRPGRWSVWVWQELDGCSMIRVPTLTPAGVVVTPVVVTGAAPVVSSAELAVDDFGTTTATAHLAGAATPAAVQLRWRVTGQATWTEGPVQNGAAATIDYTGGELDPFVAYDFDVVAFADTGLAGSLLLPGRYPLPTGRPVEDLHVTRERLGAVSVDWQWRPTTRSLVLCDGQVVSREVRTTALVITGAPGSTRTCSVAAVDYETNKLWSLTPITVTFNIPAVLPAPRITCALWGMSPTHAGQIVAARITRPPGSVGYLTGIAGVIDHSPTAPAPPAGSAVVTPDGQAGAPFPEGEDVTLYEDLFDLVAAAPKDNLYLHVWAYSPGGELVSAPASAQAHVIPVGQFSLDDPAVCAGSSSDDLAASNPGSDPTPGAGTPVAWASGPVWLTKSRTAELVVAVPVSTAGRVAVQWHRPGKHKWARVSKWVNVPAGAGQVGVHVRLPGAGSARWVFDPATGATRYSAARAVHVSKVTAKRVSSKKLPAGKVVRVRVKVSALVTQTLSVSARIGRRWQVVSSTAVPPGRATTLNVTVPRATTRLRVGFPGAPARVVRC